MGLTEELRQVQFSSYGEVFEKFKELSDNYGHLPASSLISAFGRATGESSVYSWNNPYIQNRRVKQIATLPVDYSKDKVADMLVAPDSNEQPLRAVEHSLEVTAYPMFHMRKVYQDLLTYHSYTAPEFSDDSDAKSKDFWREWKLVEKLRKAMFPAAEAHRIVGQCCQEGKVFYYPRYRVDKPHNKVDFAFMQQLPSDWVKIVGYNNKSKYTLAFNLMYFMQPGTDYRQFGDLLAPYMDDFSQVIQPVDGIGKTVVYARQKARPSLDALKKLGAERTLAGNPEVFYQNGLWYYWVTLPIDKVFTFEIDDVATNVISPFTGLFLNMIQLAQYEQIQLELTQNPLISVVTGEIPFRDDRNATKADPYKLGPTARQYFEDLWYRMLMANNTSGVGIYFAPAENIKLHQLAEAPSAMQISSTGYGYTIAKAGMAGIIPTSDDPKAGLANISLQIESKFAQPVYRCFERMMEVVFENLRLKYDWRFRMFGDIATDKQTLDSVRSEMTLGLSQSMLIYNALYDRSIFDDLSVSAALLESGLFDLRRPLMTSYSGNFDSKQQNDSNDLDGTAKKVINPGGRPPSEEITSEGNEHDADNPASKE